MFMLLSIVGIISFNFLHVRSSVIVGKFSVRMSDKCLEIPMLNGNEVTNKILEFKNCQPTEFTAQRFKINELESNFERVKITSSQANCVAISWTQAIYLDSCAASNTNWKLSSQGNDKYQFQATIGQYIYCLGFNSENMAVITWCNYENEITIPTTQLKVGDSDECLVRVEGTNKLSFASCFSGSYEMMYFTFFDSSKTYFVIRAIDGGCLDLPFGNTANGTPLQLYPCNGSPAQSWKFTRPVRNMYVGDGYWYIRSAINENKCITSNADKKIIIHDCNSYYVGGEIDGNKWTYDKWHFGDCAIGSYMISSSAADGSNCNECPPGKYVVKPYGSRFLQQCADTRPGCYSDGPTDSSCLYACPAGTHNPYYGKNSRSSCVDCISGYYSGVAASRCEGCKDRSRNVFYYSLEKSNLYDLMTYKFKTENGKCLCINGYAGTNCDFRACGEQTGFTLGSIFFLVDSQLNSFAKRYSNSTNVDENEIKSYLTVLVKTQLDLNSDGLITRSEMNDLLKSKSYDITGKNITYLWKTNYDSRTNYLNEVPVEIFINDAINNLKISKKSFDGSGQQNLKSLQVRYPNSTWDEKICTDNSHYIAITPTTTPSTTPTTPLTTLNWNIARPLKKDQTEKVCLYRDNDSISLANNDIDIVYGITKNFREKITKFGKVIYCIQLEPPNYDCAVALIYQGVPVDFYPQLTFNGVVFQYLDTSTKEEQFDIYFKKGTEDEKLAVSINTPSRYCGRTSKHISFADNINSQEVGKKIIYRIQAIQSTISTSGAKTYEEKPESTVSIYHIPFYVKVKGLITTLEGANVVNASVTYTRVDKITKLADKNLSFTFQTDQFGQYEGEIQVSDNSWNSKFEYFQIRPSLVSIINSGKKISLVTHAFSPPFTTAKLTHLTTADPYLFRDVTESSIFGKIKFDTLFTNGYDCFMQNIPVRIIKSDNQSKVVSTGIIGNFSYGITPGDSVTIQIPNYKGYSWRSVVTSTSASTTSAPNQRRLLEKASIVYCPGTLSVTCSGCSRCPYNQICPSCENSKMSRMLQSASNATSLSPSEAPTEASIPPRVSTASPYPSIALSIVPSFLTTISLTPSANSSVSPLRPSTLPSKAPTTFPSIKPSSFPSAQPSTSSMSPSLNPSVSPSTIAPSVDPSKAPTDASIPPRVSTASPYPSIALSIEPSFLTTISLTPSVNSSVTPLRPSTLPSKAPTTFPSIKPSSFPSAQPSTSSMSPSLNPSVSPSTIAPSVDPSIKPTSIPSLSPIALGTLGNSGFESGLVYWTSYGNTSTINYGCYSGSTCAVLGSNVSGTNADSSLTQSFFVIKGRTLLSFWYKMTCPNTVQFHWSTVKLVDDTTKTEWYMPKVCENSQIWTQVTRGVIPGHSYTLTLINHDGGNKTKPSYTLFDSVTLQPRSPSFKPTFSPSTVKPSYVPSRPTVKPTHDPSIVPTFSPSFTPSKVPTFTPTSTPSVKPTFEPSFSPSRSPTFTPSVKPTYEPSFTPSRLPTLAPSVKPSFQPTFTPSSSPTIAPSVKPTFQPSRIPTRPSVSPTFVPSKPSVVPTVNPSKPSASPTYLPSEKPSCTPTFLPSKVPTFGPTFTPSRSPTSTPSVKPTFEPTFTPSRSPTFAPSVKPTFEPSFTPSRLPTLAPSLKPTFEPSFSPSRSPTLTPSVKPSFQPTFTPSSSPTIAPSVKPTFQPSRIPTRPSVSPTFVPSKPSVVPTFFPTVWPSFVPTISPSMTPTITPSLSPVLIGAIGSGVAYWTSTGNTSIVSGDCYVGNTCVMLGSKLSATNGDSSFTQSFIVVKGRTLLSFWYKMTCPDTVQFDWATAILVDNTANTEWHMPKVCENSEVWTQVTRVVIPSHSYTLTLINHDDNFAEDPSYTLFDSGALLMERTREVERYNDNYITVDQFKELVYEFQFDNFDPQSNISNIFANISCIETSCKGFTLGSFGTPATLHNNIIIENGAAVFSYSSNSNDRNLIPYIELPSADNLAFNLADILSIEIDITFASGEPELNPLYLLVGNVALTLFQSECLKYPSCTGELTRFHIVYILNANSKSKSLWINGGFVNTTYQSDMNYKFGSVLIGSTGSNLVGMNSQLNRFSIYFGELTAEDIEQSCMVYTDNSGNFNIVLLSGNTMSNISVTIYATSRQLYNAGLYGGTTGDENGKGKVQVDMFGSETNFQFVPKDSTCEYKPVFNMDELRASQFLIAMDYNVTLMSTTNKAPKFHSDFCYFPSLSCYCSSAVQDPLTYMTNTGLLIQDSTVTNINQTIAFKYDFLYRTGVCFQIQSTANLPGINSYKTYPGMIDSDSKKFVEDAKGSLVEACYLKGTSFLTQDVEQKVNVILFERYPEGNGWISPLVSTITEGLFSFYIPNTQIIINDEISGKSSVTSQFNTNISKPTINVPNPTKPDPFVYTINPKRVNPSAPYSLTLDIFVQRNSPGQISAASNKWYIPVLGVIQNEVPNYYPIATDPNLIFLVLRDPPGGSSFASITRGMTYSVGISIDGMHTLDSSVGGEFEGKVGLSSGSRRRLTKSVQNKRNKFSKDATNKRSQRSKKKKLEKNSDWSNNMEGMSAMMETKREQRAAKKKEAEEKDNLVGYINDDGHPDGDLPNLFRELGESSMSILVTGGMEKTHDVETSRSSNKAFDYHFTFTSIFSTSTDPFIAGHASDIIVGGGMDIVVAQGIQVLRDTLYNGNAKYPSYSECVYARDTNLWHPAKLTTFILPVIEIENTIKRLQVKHDGIATGGDTSNTKNTDGTPGSRDTSQDDIVSLKKQISNWNKVLTNYRDHNDNYNGAFNSASIQFSNIVNSYHDFKNNKGDSKLYISQVAGLTQPLYPEQDYSELKTASEQKSEDTHSKPGVAGLEATQDVKQMFLNSFNDISNTCSGKNDPGNAPDYTPSNSICSDFDSNKWKDFYGIIQSCSDPYSSNMKNPDDLSVWSESGTTAAPVKDKNDLSNFKECMVGKASDENIPGGIDKNSIGKDITMFGFLDPNKDQIVTFSSHAPVTMTYSSEVSDSLTFSSNFQQADPMSWHIGGEVEFYAALPTPFFIFPGIGGSFSGGAKFSSDTKVTIGKSSTSSHSNTREVSIYLDDSDIGDYFAVKIGEDPVYGTPVFTTLGGQSMCPGETMTSRREMSSYIDTQGKVISGVEIVGIVARCGPTRNEPCTEAYLSSDATAIFGVKIQNLSPTKDSVNYVIQLKSSYDKYFDGAYQSTGAGACGVSGRRAGLLVDFSSTEVEIPYKEIIEIPFFVTSSGLCDMYNNIEIEIISACEISSSGHYVYQYGVIDVEGVKKISYDPAHIIHASNSTKSFSVSWSSKSSADVFAQSMSGLLSKTDVRPSDMAIFGMLIIIILFFILFAYIVWKQSVILQSLRYNKGLEEDILRGVQNNERLETEMFEVLKRNKPEFSEKDGYMRRKSYSSELSKKSINSVAVDVATKEEFRINVDE